MKQIAELYEKVAADSMLQAKLKEIMSAAQKDEKEATETKLIAFAEDAGYHITSEEIQDFFRGRIKLISCELSNDELDQVAGGKAGMYEQCSNCTARGLCRFGIEECSLLS